MKINIALSSGNKMEKPLVSAFRGTTGTYVVLDNEANGTMGLPIILISKLNGNNLELITDGNEWNTVKEYLRNGVAGNQMDYVAVPTDVTGNDGFYKQLTLSIDSFAALKANYKVEESVVETPVAPVVEPTPEVVPTAVEQPVEEPVAPVMPTMDNISPVGPMPEVVPQPIPMPEPEVAPTVVEQPVVEPVIPAAPVMPEAPVAQVEETVVPVMPEVEPIPAMPEAPTMDFSVDKEAFLKACENMFDALVAKINK